VGKKLRQLALISAYDKEGLESIARVLSSEGMELVATGNTRTLLEGFGFPVTDVSQITGEPERFGGRVKTLHHKILGGILFRPGVDDAEWTEDFRVSAVVCNFYPFEEKSLHCDSVDDLMEWVDIGGPTMVRSAAKNFRHVLVFTRKEQYTRYLSTPRGETDPTAVDRLKQRLSLEAFDVVRDYDEAIATRVKWKALGPSLGGGVLTYGENPHQKADFSASRFPGLRFVGASVSYNNLRDAEAAFRFVAAFGPPAVAVVKHQTLCGAAAGLLGALPDRVFHWAWEGDDVSRFGGILAFNHCPSSEVEAVLAAKFIELLLMPRSPSAEALCERLTKQKPKLRCLLVEPNFFESQLVGTRPIRETIRGALGTLCQDPDHITFERGLDDIDWTRHSLRFGQWAAACSKSNAMVLTGGLESEKICFVTGAGQGQPNRLDALQKLALPRAAHFSERLGIPLSEMTCFSDAFLSHVDTLTALSQAGVKRLIQPGGSKADDEVADAARKLNVDMKILGQRRFWH
jgi:phosphoribosylaminoimidazolecarboxamide formyltransferase/IMP cyclohydrolase